MKNGGVIRVTHSDTPPEPVITLEIKKGISTSAEGLSYIMQFPLSKEVLAFALSRELNRTLNDAEQSGVAPLPYQLGWYISNLSRAVIMLEEDVPLGDDDQDAV